jgi:hypothetical protein
MEHLAAETQGSCQHEDQAALQTGVHGAPRTSLLQI